MSFNAIRGNKIIAKISKFTVKLDKSAHVQLWGSTPCAQRVSVNLCHALLIIGVFLEYSSESYANRNSRAATE